VLAALAAGCGSEGGSVEGPVTVYVSLPLTGPRAADGQDAADGARLALEQAGGRAGDLEVTAEFLDDARGRAWDPVAVGENARTAVQDSSTVAYIGELDSEPTRGSLPITNEAGIAQVSPGAGAVDLTRVAEGYPGSPDSHRPSGDATFARVVADDAVVARAAAQLAVDSGATRVALRTADDPFSELMASEFVAAAAAVGIQVVEQGQLSDAAFVAEPAEPSLRLDGERDAEVTGALDAANLPDAAFADSFSESFDHDPGPYAAYGYEAMDLILDAIGAAEVSEDGFRAGVLDGILGADRPDSALGPHSIDDEGDTTLCAVQPYEAVDGGRVAGKPICPTG
jgi:branched-chain amino acid transport system substrate-binding protein